MFNWLVILVLVGVNSVTDDSESDPRSHNAQARSQATPIGGGQNIFGATVKPGFH